MSLSPDSKVHGANMGPPGSCRPQMGPMLAPWTLLSGSVWFWLGHNIDGLGQDWSNSTAPAVELLQSCSKPSICYHITGINPEACLMGVDHYDHPLCPGLQPGPPSQTPGGLGQRYWSVSEVTWPPKMEFRRWGSSGPSSLMSCNDAGTVM